MNVHPLLFRQFSNKNHHHSSCQSTENKEFSNDQQTNKTDKNLNNGKTIETQIQVQEQIEKADFYPYIARVIENGNDEEKRHKLHKIENEKFLKCSTCGHSPGLYSYPTTTTTSNNDNHSLQQSSMTLSSNEIIDVLKEVGKQEQQQRLKEHEERSVVKNLSDNPLVHPTTTPSGQDPISQSMTVHAITGDEELDQEYNKENNKDTIHGTQMSSQNEKELISTETIDTSPNLICGEDSHTPLKEDLASMNKENEINSKKTFMKNQKEHWISSKQMEQISSIVEMDKNNVDCYPFAIRQIENQGSELKREGLHRIEQHRYKMCPDCGHVF